MTLTHRFLPAFVLLTISLAACADPSSDTGPGASGTTCTLVGCESNVTANFLGLLAAHSDGLPLSIDVCLDGACISATVQVQDGKGEGCTDQQGMTCCANTVGTACCAVDPATPVNVCFASAGSTVRISLPVADSGAFEGASHTVSAKVRDKDGNVLLDAEHTTKLSGEFPNGPQCGAACYAGGLDFGSGTP